MIEDTLFLLERFVAELNLGILILICILLTLKKTK